MHALLFLVNGVVANKDTLIKNNDLITHRVHRHEPPVIGERINIIHKDDDLVVINKPPSIPVCCVVRMYMLNECSAPPSLYEWLDMGI